MFQRGSHPAAQRFRALALLNGGQHGVLLLAQIALLHQLRNERIGSVIHSAAHQVDLGRDRGAVCIERIDRQNPAIAIHRHGQTGVHIKRHRSGGRHRPVVAHAADSERQHRGCRHETGKDGAFLLFRRRRMERRDLAGLERGAARQDLIQTIGRFGNDLTCQTVEYFFVSQGHHLPSERGACQVHDCILK